MHTKFSGQNGQHAHRWLRTLRYEKPQIDTVSPSDWLGIVDGLLEGDAAIWADHHPRVKHILRAGNLKQATRDDVETFKKALIARFPLLKMPIAWSPRPDLNISSPILVQAPDENLDSYYARTLTLLYERGGVDLPEAPLTEQEQDALKRTIIDHIAGLTDSEIRQEAEKAWTESNASLGLLQFYRLSKDRMVQRLLEADWSLLFDQDASDQAPDRANVPGSSFDNPASRSYMENVGNPDNLPKPNDSKLATEAGDRPNIFDDLHGTPGGAKKDTTLNHRPFPELLPRKPTDTTASTSEQVRSSPREKGFTSRMGDSHRTTPELFTRKPNNATTSTWEQMRNPPHQTGYTSRLGDSHRTTPELFTRKPTKFTNSTREQVRNPPHQTGFTSRVGNSHHTPNTNNGSTPPTTLPNAGMFGGATGSPSRPQSSLFEASSSPYSIFDARHPAVRDRTSAFAQRESAKFFGNVTAADHDNPPPPYSGMPPPGLSLFDPLTRKPNGSLFGGEPAPSRAANHDNPPQPYSGMPPPGFSSFDPLTRKPNGSLFGGETAPDRAANQDNPPPPFSGMPYPSLPPFNPLPENPTRSLFGDGPAPSRASKGTSPNRHSRRPSKLDVGIDHLPPSRLSEDTVRQFYSPNRNIFGNFSSTMQGSSSGIPNTAKPSNFNTAASDASATTSHHPQAPSIQIQTPSIFDTRDIKFPGPKDHPTRDELNVVDDFFMRHFPDPDTRPASQATEPAHERHDPKPPFQSVEDAFNHCFHRPETHLSPQATNPTHKRSGHGPLFETAQEEYMRKFRQRNTNPSSQATNPTHERYGPNPHFQSSEDEFLHYLRHHNPNTHSHPLCQSTSSTPPPNNHGTPNTTNPFQTSMDEFMRSFSRLNTHPSSQSTSPSLTNPTLSSPHNPPTISSHHTNSTPSYSPSPLSYSQTLTANANATANANTNANNPPHATVESDSEPELDIPITFKQSQGKKKKRRRRRAKKGGEASSEGGDGVGWDDGDVDIGGLR